MSMWIWTTELTLSGIEFVQPAVVYDSEFSFSFGQVRSYNRSAGKLG